MAMDGPVECGVEIVGQGKGKEGREERPTRKLQGRQISHGFGGGRYIEVCGCLASKES